MQRVLFHSTIFGPIHSRRLGTSLGVNLMPNDGKICSFDCVYCEAGWNAQGVGTTGMPSREQVRQQLEAKLIEMHAAGDRLDVITFSGNGEPTLHPDFEGIMADTVDARNRFFPEAKVSVLCNSTRLDRESVCRALLHADNCILKLDSALTPTMRLINMPNSPTFTCETLIPRLAKFGSRCIIQTMMLRGNHDGKHIDNTTDEEIEALIAAYRTIAPGEVMLYSLDRATPETDLQKVERDELDAIAARIAKAANVKIVTA
jgi:wyosine [tRNA(Phe)-imidazoG37] synthetase (radical SAM superfamily)